ncbi:hypothetical protein GL982_11120 (plasmid) [Spiroplasma citri]|uniref:hypothetical protein n=1 Tax=Spiroplasma citri TaxID=2133 RepID=UPI0013A09C1B|nr:hypothetical protein [Spiroplasma citri]QIA74091.1 hypothetical protein GL982_11120 [Spiroplasma citri]
MNLENLKGLCKEIIKFYEEEQKNENILEEDIEKISNLRIQKLLFLYMVLLKRKKRRNYSNCIWSMTTWPCYKRII